MSNNNVLHLLNGHMTLDLDAKLAEVSFSIDTPSPSLISFGDHPIWQCPGWSTQNGGVSGTIHFSGKIGVVDPIGLSVQANPSIISPKHPDFYYNTSLLTIHFQNGNYGGYIAKILGTDQVWKQEYEEVFGFYWNGKLNGNYAQDGLHTFEFMSDGEKAQIVVAVDSTPPTISEVTVKKGNRADQWIAELMITDPVVNGASSGLDLIDQNPIISSTRPGTWSVTKEIVDSRHILVRATYTLPTGTSQLDNNATDDAIILNPMRDKVKNTNADFKLFNLNNLSTPTPTPTPTPTLQPPPVPPTNLPYGKPIPKVGSDCISSGGKYRIKNIYDFHPKGPDLSIVVTPEYTMGPINPDLTNALQPENTQARFELPGGEVQSEATMISKHDPVYRNKKDTESDKFEDQNANINALLSKDEYTGVAEIKEKPGITVSTEIALGEFPSLLKLARDYKNTSIPLTIGSDASQGLHSYEEHRRYYAMILSLDTDSRVRVVRGSAKPGGSFMKFVDALGNGQSGTVTIYFDGGDTMKISLKKKLVNGGVEWAWQCAQ